MLVSIHQPNYFPWLGYFYKIYKSDIFIFLDDVQYNNEGLQNYHYVKTANGRLRLKVPVTFHHGDLIKDVSINHKLDWQKKHIKTIELNYRKTRFFDEVFSDYSDLITKKELTISSFDIEIIKFISRKFNFKTKFYLSSELAVNTAKTQKIIDLCKVVGATTYLSGVGAKAYQDENLFYSNSIGLIYSNFKPFTYDQLWGDFEGNVSVLDYLMNYGYDWDFVLSHE